MSTVMNAVYNNYLSTYAPKSMTRYDSHKKSELRNVYQSIIKLNKESPWYLPTTSRDVQHYAIDIKEYARGLYNSIAQLGGLEDQLLEKKQAYSSDPQVASAAYIGSPVPEEEAPGFVLEVQSLASPQENMGYYLNDRKVELAPDTYSFDIAINDMNYEFQFSVGENETNRQLQERLARLVNNAGIGLKASVNESEGKTSLRMVSDATGLSPGHSDIFRISDQHTSKQDGAVDYFGLDYISHEASNARFLLNGEERSASSNHFTIGKEFEVTLHGISPEDKPVEIGLKADVDSLTDNVTQLIGSFNEFQKAASQYIEFQSRSRQLMGEMKGIAVSYYSSLESTGMAVQEDGTISVNQDQLQQATMDSGDIKETFGYLRDFATALLHKSSQVSLNPMDYVDKTIVAYKNPGRSFISPYSTSPYSGMMFSSYC